MAKSERKRLPWEKELVDLNKFDWLTAVGLSHWHKHSPLQLRIAIALMQHANDGNIAWPSQQTLAQYAGVADSGQVRKAVRALKNSGSISYCRISQLDDVEQAKITRQKRGLAYALEFFWAYEQLEESQNPLRAMPKQLRDGKARKQLNRSTADRSNRSTADRYTPVHDRPPYKEGTEEISVKKALNEEGSESTREALASGYAARNEGHMSRSRQDRYLDRPGYEDKVAPTPARARDPIPLFCSDAQAQQWLLAHDVFPGDLDGLARKMVDGDLVWSDVERSAA